MQFLCERVRALNGVELLRYAWIMGQGTDTNVDNVFVHDMDRTKEADLVVVILDEPSFGAGMEIMRRCEVCDALRLFYPHGQQPPRIITGCIVHYREARFGPSLVKEREMPDPIEYLNDEEIFQAIVAWVEAHKRPPELEAAPSA